MQPTAPVARRILVVCLGNHCRSPLAAAILAHLGGTGVDVRSAGLTGRHVDRPAHPLMVTAAKQLGYDLTGHRGVQLTAQLLAWADLVLAMDQAVAEQLLQRTDPVNRHKVRSYLTDADVPDPWGQTAVDFAACAALIDTGAAQHLKADQDRTKMARGGRYTASTRPVSPDRNGQACPSTAPSVSTHSA